MIMVSVPDADGVSGMSFISNSHSEPTRSDARGLSEDRLHLLNHWRLTKTRPCPFSPAQALIQTDLIRAESTKLDSVELCRVLPTTNPVLGSRSSRTRALREFSANSQLQRCCNIA